MMMDRIQSEIIYAMYNEKIALFSHFSVQHKVQPLAESLDEVKEKKNRHRWTLM
jgi:hypothetical protein